MTWKQSWFGQCDRLKRALRYYSHPLLYFDFLIIQLNLQPIQLHIMVRLVVIDPLGPNQEEPAVTPVMSNYCINMEKEWECTIIQPATFNGPLSLFISFKSSFNKTSSWLYAFPSSIRTFLQTFMFLMELNVLSTRPHAKKCSTQTHTVVSFSVPFLIAIKLWMLSIFPCEGHTLRLKWNPIPHRVHYFEPFVEPCRSLDKEKGVLWDLPPVSSVNC